MRKLHTKVNLIPVIAKSDTMTDDEIVAFKRRILDDIAYQNIRIFQPPMYENEDEETLQENEEILVRFFPVFSLLSSSPLHFHAVIWRG